MSTSVLRPSPTSDKRANYRHRCIRPVSVCAAGKSTQCHTYDISPGGVALISAETIALGAVSLVFPHCGLTLAGRMVGHTAGAEAGLVRHHVAFCEEIDLMTLARILRHTRE